MTNLTDKWKKGELPSGWYYVKLIRGEYRTDLYIKDKNEWIDCPDKIISEVLAPVPSYEEWQAKLEENARLKAIKEKTYNYDYLSECYSKFTKENTKLKELLKECSYRIDWTYKTGHKPTDDGRQKLFNEISQVLGEE